MKNKKTLFIVAGLGALAIAVAYFYKKGKSNSSSVIPESVVKTDKAISDAISKYGSLDNIPKFVEEGINDQFFASTESGGNTNQSGNSSLTRVGTRGY